MIMQKMNYGKTISAQDLINNQSFIRRCRRWYGLLQFAYFSSKGGVVGVDVVDEC
jgi:hypothetical protein